MELASVMLAYLAGCGSILVTWALTLLSLCGIGALVLRAAGGAPRSHRDWAISGFLGLALLLFALIVWNFLWPIGGTAWACAFAVGALGVFRERRSLGNALRTLPRPFVWSALALGLWLANLALAANNSWDSGLYHIQAVNWAQAFPVVPGLANLHGPLGFNNANLLLFAMLDSGPWEGRANHLGNGLVLWGLGMLALLGVVQLLRQRGGAGTDASAGFDAVLLVPTFFLATGGRVSSFETDLMPAAFVMVAGSEAFHLLSRTRSASDRGHSLLTCFVILAAAVSCKSSSAAFAVGLAALLGAYAFRLESTPAMRRALAAGAAIAGACGLIWMGRGVILSGYPAFPMDFLGLPVDWRVPSEHAMAELAYAGFTERRASWTLGTPWLRLGLIAPYYVLVPFAVALGAALLWRTRAKLADAGEGAVWRLAVAGPVILAIGAWLATVPSYRYATGIAWVGAAVAVGHLATALTWPSARRLGVAVVVLAISAPIIQPALFALTRVQARNPFLEIVRSVLSTPGPDVFFHPTIHELDLEEFETNSALVLTVARHHCWDAPLPCTPNPSPTLELRDPARLDRGFRTAAGQWQMLHFPYRNRAGFLEEWRSRGAPGYLTATSAVFVGPDPPPNDQ